MIVMEKSIMSDRQVFFDTDAYTPKQMAARVETSGVAKAELAIIPLLMLSILAGAFIAFGAMFYTMTVTGSTMGLGPTRLLGGAAFSLGLILVLVGGAELFTGNSLVVMAWADRKVSTVALLRNWGLVYIGNFVGALATAAFVWLSGVLAIDHGAVAQTAIAIAAGKLQLGWQEAFFRGILCNVLVCLAVWLCFAARSVAGKILAILFPITAFVALGFEHSVANMYLIPIGMASAGVINIVGLLHNLFFVTLGNMVGGGLLVAAVYYVIYVRRS